MLREILEWKSRKRWQGRQTVVGTLFMFLGMLVVKISVGIIGWNFARLIVYRNEVARSRECTNCWRGALALSKLYQIGVKG